MAHLRTKSLVLVSSFLGLLAITGCAASTEEDDDAEVVAPDLSTVSTADRGKGKGVSAIEQPNNHTPLPPVPFPIPRGSQK